MKRLITLISLIFSLNLAGMELQKQVQVTASKPKEESGHFTFGHFPREILENIFCELLDYIGKEKEFLEKNPGEIAKYLKAFFRERFLGFIRAEKFANNFKHYLFKKCLDNRFGQLVDSKHFLKPDVASRKFLDFWLLANRANAATCTELITNHCLASGKESSDKKRKLSFTQEIKDVFTDEQLLYLLFYFSAIDESDNKDLLLLIKNLFAKVAVNSVQNNKPKSNAMLNIIDTDHVIILSDMWDSIIDSKKSSDEKMKALTTSFADVLKWEQVDQVALDFAVHFNNKILARYLLRKTGLIHSQIDLNQFKSLLQLAIIADDLDSYLQLESLHSARLGTRLAQNTEHIWRIIFINNSFNIAKHFLTKDPSIARKNFKLSTNFSQPILTHLALPSNNKGHEELAQAFIDFDPTLLFYKTQINKDLKGSPLSQAILYNNDFVRDWINLLVKKTDKKVFDEPIAEILKGNGKVVEFNIASYAVACDNLDIFQFLYKLSGDYIYQRASDGNNLWLVACVQMLHKKQKLKLFEFLYSVNPDFIKSTTPGGECALHIAAFKNYTEIVQWLLEKDESLVCQKTILGCTPLLGAILSKTTETIESVKKILEKVPESINDVSNELNGVLHYAAYHNRTDLAELFLAKKPTLLYEKNKKGQTAFDVAAENKSNEVMAFLAKVQQDAIKTQNDDLAIDIMN